MTSYCKLRHFLKLHLLQEMNSREVSKVFILIISWINTQHLHFLFIHNLSWSTFHPEVDNGMPYICNLFLTMHVFHVPFSSFINYFQSSAVFMFSPLNGGRNQWFLHSLTQLYAYRHLISAFNHNDVEAGLFSKQK